MLDVYKSIYNLEGQPFRLTPDYHFTYEHPSYGDAMAYLKYAIAEGEGFVAITGEPGTGKTTLIGKLLSELDQESVMVATIANAQLDSEKLVERVARAFRLDIDKNRKSPLMLLEQYLVSLQQDDKRAILIVDEAQGLSANSLEELRLLSNLQHNMGLLLQVFLVGQDPLMDMVRSPGMEQLHQRLIAASRLVPLNYDETAAYVEHRLRKVGWNNSPRFTDEALNLVHKFSCGIPRRINLICHRLFLHGGLNQRYNLTGGDALHVIVELHKEGLLTPVARRALGEYVGGIKGMEVNS